MLEKNNWWFIYLGVFCGKMEYLNLVSRKKKIVLFFFVKFV